MKQLFVILFLIVAALSMRAQNDTVVSFVNVYAGSSVYELEGHSMLRVNMGHDADIAISYGQFDFDSPNFIYRFVKGETDYMVGAYPWNVIQRSYLGEGRRMVEHTLNMNSDQKRRLVELLKENLKPENRVYRYNYVKDNCATRPLRMVELAMGDSIMLGASLWDEQHNTFRSVMQYFHTNYPWYQLGIDLCLGSGVDYPLNRRELSFAPIVLDEQIAESTVNGKPLVKSSVAIVDLPINNAVSGSTPGILSPKFVFGLVFLLLLILTYQDQRHRRVTKWADAVLFGVFGIEGLILSFLIFVSVHEATSPNWLYLWLNPLCLIVPVFIWLKKCKKLVLSYHFINFVSSFALCFIWIAEVQYINYALLPLIFSGIMRSTSYIKLNFKRNAE